MSIQELYVPALIRDKITPKGWEVIKKVHKFVTEDCIPADEVFEAQMPEVPSERWLAHPPILEELKAKAKAQGLWNLFLHKHYSEGAGLSNVEYAVMAEIAARSTLASEAMNISAPDTGNMEVLAKYGTEAQKKQWLEPLLNGTIRSAFCMTEPEIASSDATNIQTRMHREGNEYVINGRKWWITGAGDTNCKIMLVMVKSDPTNPDIYKQQSVILVPKNHPGVTLIRPLRVMGYDDAPHGHFEIEFKDVRVPLENIILGEGNGFEIIQGRLGPGRIHHCMRSVGVAEKALDYMILRATDTRKVAFGKMLKDHGGVILEIAKARMNIEAARLCVLNAADEIDKVGAKGAQSKIAIAKVFVPQITQYIVDMAMQMYGAEGVCQTTSLPRMFAKTRTLRIADGPDEAHLYQLGRREIKRGDSVRNHAEIYKAKTQEMLKARNLSPKL